VGRQQLQPRKVEKHPAVTWYGENGMMTQNGEGYEIFDTNGKQIGKGNGPGGDIVHMSNFLKAIRGEAKPNSEIEVGQTSTCSVTSATSPIAPAARSTSIPTTRKIVGDKDAEKFWAREYRPGWEPKV
jgi:hypothetical protein